MGNLGLVEENVTKDLRNLFRLKKETQAIKDRILRDIINLFKYEEEEKNYCKPVTVRTFLSNTYIEYESSGNKNKILSVEEYLNKIKPYLKDIINNLKSSHTCKIQPIIAIMINNEANEVIK